MPVIEDVHWADEAILHLLRFVGRRVRDARALVLVTCRDDSLAADDPLRIALGELSTQRTARRLSLPPLSAGAVAELAVGPGVEPSAFIGSPAETPSTSRRRYRPQPGLAHVGSLGPSADASTTVHREAHGLVAEEVFEVQEGS